MRDKNYCFARLVLQTPRMKLLNVIMGISQSALIEIKNEQVCYPVLGCFDNEEPYDCLGTRNQVLNFD